MDEKKEVHLQPETGELDDCNKINIDFNKHYCGTLLGAMSSPRTHPLVQSAPL